MSSLGFYVDLMESLDAHKAGVAKIVPPPEWKARASGYKDYGGFKRIPSPLRQNLKPCPLNSGCYMLNNECIKDIDFKKFLKVSEEHKPNDGDKDLEDKFWKNDGKINYGADVPGSLIDPSVKDWNINELGSIFDEIKGECLIKGMHNSFLNFGMRGTTFAFHTEDYDTYSINYLHYGHEKIWYVVPPGYGKKFEKVAGRFYPDERNQCPAFLRHKKILISPSVLKNSGIPVGTVKQKAGEFIMTFPYAYHQGFNSGFNCAEASNFATKRWVKYAMTTTHCHCGNRTQVHVHIDRFVFKYQCGLYHKWIKGNSDL